MNLKFLSTKAYFVTSDTHIRKLRFIADVTAEIFKIKNCSVGKRELVFVPIVHLFVGYAHVNLCHFFSSSWCRGLAAASASGSSWTFLYTFLEIC